MKIIVIGLRGIPHVIGGIETQCEQLYPAILDRDSRVKVHLFVRSNYVEAKRDEYRGIVIHRLWAPSVPGVEALFHTFFCLLNTRLFLSPDIVHLHGIGPAIWTPLARLLGLRTVVTHHAPDYDRPKWSRPARLLLKCGEAMAAHFAHHIICVSRSVHTLLVTRHPIAAPRASVIYNAIRPFHENEKTAGAILEELSLEKGRYVVAVGRLDQTKRFQDLIAAHARLGDNALPLVIVGTSVDGDHYGDRLKRSTHPGVIFAGFRSGSALAALYRHAALFIHPSEMEGFGLVVLEALGMDIPVMLSNIPPHREFGLPDSAYFQVGDVDAIERALISGATPPREKYRALLSRYDLDNAVQAHLSVYRKLVPRGPKELIRPALETPDQVP